jgi:hypothetical protein
MAGSAYRLSVVWLLVSGLTWTSAIHAFFCFSIGGGKRPQRLYTHHLPYAVFGRNDFQYLPYSPARAVMRFNLRPPREEAQETVEPMPVQHIFK